MSSFFSTLKCACGREHDIVITEKVAEKPMPAPSELPSVTRVESELGELAKLVDISQSGSNGPIVVMKKIPWLDTRDWDDIDRLLIKFNALWIRDKENSRWEI